MSTTSPAQAVPAWQPNEETVTFSTGRRMVLRRSVPAMWLAVEGAATGEDDATANALDALLRGEPAPDRFAVRDLVASLVEMMSLRPRILWDPAQVPVPPRDQAGEVIVDDNGWPDIVWAGDLDDAELNEIVERGAQGVARAARFRPDQDGAGDGSDGAGVGSAPKPRRRTGTRKS